MVMKNKYKLEVLKKLLCRRFQACCLDYARMNSEGGSNISLDAVIQVSLLMVELISPDVMYNGLPWPEEEFCKVCNKKKFFFKSE